MYSEFGISIFNLDDKIFLESARKKSFFYRRLGFSITSENVFLEVSGNNGSLKSIYRGGTLKECSPKRTKWLLWMLAVRVLPSRYELVMNHYGCWLYDLSWNIY